MAEKSEKATPKKLRDAKKKGQVAKSQDLPSAFTFIVSIWVTVGMAEFLYHQMSDYLVAAFRNIPNKDLPSIIVQFWANSYAVIFIASMPILVIVSLLGVAITFFTVGPVFAPEVFKFDPKKFDPIQN